MILLYFLFFLFLDSGAATLGGLFIFTLPSFSDLHHFPLFVIIYSDRVTLCFALLFLFFSAPENQSGLLASAFLCSSLDRAIPTDQT
jgi:hypothetical protein